LNNKIKIYREAAGKTQQEIANVLGLSKPGYALKEQGRREFTIEEAIKLSDYLKTSIRSLFA
jgi:DNA-binding XRE family transcriptional regulator